MNLFQWMDMSTDIKKTLQEIDSSGWGSVVDAQLLLQFVHQLQQSGAERETAEKM